ncbi:hypothetical protein CR194_06600 [Salipaludibacillus keqinensis]|uniref:ParB/Sulfiredoxin domain-containing protein n=1 Tax=Salipaludibacillus keqinensis TaxID=2045207 RepID=A0A323TKQ0_9BACI|nr:hypothetical protein [Salipaludibacillus keqinensis]PYZ95180.1 hypothetical protein CR194_06600 [Salipaludibacillus keqinensis]
MRLSVELIDLQPSQLYLNRNKLRTLIMEGFQAEEIESDPLPVIKYNGELVLIDGHTKAFLADQQGVKNITVKYLAEVDHLNMYQKNVNLCKQEEITLIRDLAKQIIPHEDFERQWVQKHKSTTASNKGIQNDQ